MFLDDCKITVEAPTATGTSTIDSAAYDIAGFDGICFIVRLGTPAAGNNIRAQQSTTSGGAYNDLQGTLVNSATLSQHMLDLSRAGKQFVRCRVTRGTSTTIDGITVVQYRARKKPITQPATSVSELWVGPPEGTA